MGIAYGAYAAAFVVGSSVGGFVIESFGLRAPFALYLATSVLAAILVLALAGGEAADPETRHGVAVTPRIVTSNPAWARSRRVLAYATGFVYVYGLGTVLAFLPAYGADRALSPRGVGLLLGAYWIARVVGSLGAGRVSDALGPRLVLVPAMLVMVGGVALVVAPVGLWALFLGAVALGLAAGASAPTCVGLIADHASAEQRGTAMGLFEAACGVSILGSGLLGGYAAEALGGEAPYVIVGALALAWAGRPRPGPPGPRPRLIRTGSGSPRLAGETPGAAGVGRHARRRAAFRARCSRGTRPAPDHSEPWTRASGAGGSSGGARERLAGRRPRSAPPASGSPSGSPIVRARWSSSRSWRRASSAGSRSSAGARAIR